MRRAKFIAAALTLSGVGLAVSATPAHAAGRQLISAGRASLVAAAPGPDVTISANEFAPSDPRDEGGGTEAPPSGAAPEARGSRVRPAGAEVKTSFEGLNLRQQRTANGGNQFTVEPPDQGLCVGNGFVLESVNDVLRVFSTAGAPLTGVVDLNTFYKYPAAIVRPAGPFGPVVTDPSCTFDAGAQRWFHLVLTLDVNPANGAFLGPNHLDLAVSTTASPLDPWNIYRLPVQDDGTQGTPNHGCAGGPCLGDFPHIGTDAFGVYLTTNEYPFFVPGFHGAQIYAISKAALAAGQSNVGVTQFDTATDAPTKGFTIWPASAPTGGNDTHRGGTEFFLSGLVSDQSAPPPETPFGSSNRVAVWALTNTSSLSSASPSLQLSTTTSEVGTYAVPPKADQKAGDFPLGQCINDTTLFGAGCWQLLFAAEPAHDEVISKPDASDGRMNQVTYFKGKLYGAIGTAVRVGGEVRAGAEWFVIRPQVDDRKLEAETDKSGYVAVAGNNVTYPAIGVSGSGKAVMAVTLIGKDHFPSAAYVRLGSEDDSSAVNVIAAGLGPDDGFTGYKALVGDPPRTRWGDYGATAVVGDTVWVASEYIAQTCTLAQWATPPVGSCGGTRVAFGNWSTRVSAIQLQGGRSD